MRDGVLRLLPWVALPLPVYTRCHLWYNRPVHIPTVVGGGKMAIYLVCLMCWPIVVEPVAVAGTEDSGPSVRGASTVVETQSGEAGGGGCFSAGSCCVAHGEQGCVDASCCNTVCAADSLCCLIGWSESCVSLAEALCGDTCAGSCPAEGACCQSHTGGGCEDALCCDLVCTNTPSCCEAIWSNTCADLANQICDVCEEPPPSVCPPDAEGDCCAPRVAGAGCDRVNCCEIVCGLDAYCCDDHWDVTCYRKAFDYCPNICHCETFGDFDVNEAINLRDIAAFYECFTGPDHGPVATGCECADYDADDDADLDDFEPFAALFAP